MENTVGNIENTATWEPLTRDQFNLVKSGDTVRKTSTHRDVTHIKVATLNRLHNGIWYTAQGHIALHPNPHPTETHEIQRA